MKRNRIIFLILWILSLVGISFFGGPVSYGFFAMLTLLPLVSLIYLFFVFHFFRIYQELDGKHLVADQTVPFYFTLMNEYFFGFAGIRVRFFSSFSTISGLDDAAEYELLPKTGIKKQTSLACKYRGEYEVGIKMVEIQDYFRLFRIAYHNRETLRVIVKPNLVELSGLGSENLEQALPRDSQANASETDALVRKYEAGDDPRRIHWMASARSSELFVRNLTGQEREGVGILMGTHRPSEDPLLYLPVENKILELTLALALFFVKKNIEVHAHYLQGTLTEASAAGLERFDAFYEMLSGTEFGKSFPEAELFAQASGRPEVFRFKTVYMVVRELSAEALQMAKLLRDNHVFAVIYVISDEIPQEQGGDAGISVVRIGTQEDLKEVAL